MKARGVTIQQVRDAVQAVSENYDGNVAIENISQVTPTTVSFKVGTLNSRSSGSRVSVSGRRGRWACTHVFEDIMAEITKNDGVVIIPKGAPGNDHGKTIHLVTQEDVEEWATLYNTSDVGSPASPAFPTELCVGCGN